MRWERTLALVAGAAGIVFLLLAVSLFLVQQRMTQLTSYALIAGVALLIVYGILDPAAVRELVISRRSRFGSLSALVTAAVLALLVIANVLASRGTQALDLTRAQFNTLAPESVKVTKQLNSDLVVTGFFRGDEQAAERDASDLLGLYQAQNPHVKVTFVDPQQSADLARRLGIHETSTLVLQYKGKSQILTPGSQTEQDITAAILSFVANRTPNVCWVAGEGERSLGSDSQLDGYSEAANQLDKNNFKRQDLLASQAKTIPTGCDIIALVGPQKPLAAPVVKLLQAYLDGGGKLLVTADHWQDAAALDSVNTLLKPYGISFDGGLVVDVAQSAQNDPTTPAVFDYGNSAITKDLSKQVSFFPQPTGVQASSQGDGVATSLVSSSRDSYEVMKRRQNLARQNGDKGGPVAIMQTVEVRSGKKDTRIVAVGTSAFAENAVLNSPDANVQLFVGSLQWLSNQESLIALPPRGSRVQSLALSNEQANLNVFLTLVLLPALVAAGGLAVWWRRRHAY